MTGNNELHLNQATVVEAMQLYLDSIMKISPEVTGIKQKENMFIVSVSDKPKELVK